MSTNPNEQPAVRRPEPNHPLCGTDSGYYRHVRPRKSKPWKEPACFPCLDAHAAAESRRNAAAQERKAAA